MPRPILSPRRRAVAILALSGRSNREIGYELGLTPDTVGNMMHIVYQSLGLAPWAGRRHLGRALAAHGIISVLDLPARKPFRSNGQPSRYGGRWWPT
jgi:DNA-binding NarL/FixJ family response regulator